jgi:hypothetical protein
MCDAVPLLFEARNHVPSYSVLLTILLSRKKLG